MAFSTGWPLREWKIWKSRKKGKSTTIKKKSYIREECAMASVLAARSVERKRGSPSSFELTWPESRIALGRLPRTKDKRQNGARARNRKPAYLGELLKRNHAPIVRPCLWGEEERAVHQSSQHGNISDTRLEWGGYMHKADQKVFFRFKKNNVFAFLLSSRTLFWITAKGKGNHLCSEACNDRLTKPSHALNNTEHQDQISGGNQLRSSANNDIPRFLSSAGLLGRFYVLCFI